MDREIKFIPGRITLNINPKKMMKKNFETKVTETINGTQIEQIYFNTYDQKDFERLPWRKEATNGTK